MSLVFSDLDSAGGLVRKGLYRENCGIILIVLGVFALVYQGITYTTQEEVLDVGPLEVVKKDSETIPLHPIVGILLVGGGLVLVLIGRPK